MGGLMRVRRIPIENFRGVAHGVVDFLGHTLLVGGNNVGKSTVCEAIDLVLGTERLFRRPVVDEHDFHNGLYCNEAGTLVVIKIEVVLIDLPDDMRRKLFTRPGPGVKINRVSSMSTVRLHPTPTRQASFARSRSPFSVGTIERPTILREGHSSPSHKGKP